ncbi:MAG: AMP-binding protein, partial [Gammaproteobacteria bacterium]
MEDQVTMSATSLIPGVLTDRPQPAEQYMPALECGDRRFDYGQLDRLVQTLAANLADRGVTCGSRVALAARRDCESYAAMLALLALGAVYVPLDPGYPAPRLAAMLKGAEADFVVGAPSALASLPPHTVSELSLDTEDNASRTLRPLPKIDSTRLAYILFTSGSTGTPKGVAMPRGPLARLIGWQQTQPRLCRPARTLAFAPLSFDIHVQELHSTLATGGCLVLVEETVRRDP